MPSSGETPESRQTLVDGSGFPFQQRIELELPKVRDFVGRQRWRVAVREYWWRDQLTETDQFIDLVIREQGGHRRLVIEAKRLGADVRGELIFLVPEDVELTSKATVLESTPENGKVPYTWQQRHVTPNSLESEFCVLRGQANDTRPMLERTSGILVRSLEQYALYEAGFRQAGDSSPFTFAAVIVTNATLIACRYSVADVNLATGTWPSGQAQFEVVPYVRFHKSMPTTAPAETIYTTLPEFHEGTKRTVFVVNSESLTDFLTRWDL